MHSSSLSDTRAFTGNPLIAVVTNDGLQLDVYESIAPFIIHSPDIMWMRSPVLIVAIGVAIVFYYKSRNDGLRNPLEGLGGGMGGGGGGFDKREFDRLVANLDKSGGAGGMSGRGFGGGRDR